MMPFFYKIVVVAVNWAPSILSLVVESGGEHADHESGHDEKPELPNLIGLFFSHSSWAHEWINIIFAFAVAILFVMVALIVYRKRQIIPGPFQNFIEMLVEGMYNFIYSMLGKEAKRYAPFLGTLFFYVLALNFLGLIPLGHSPSTSINITFSMAICVFCYAQYTGIRRLGIVKYLDHLAGEPRTGITWGLVIIILPIHIIGELAKPLSLGLRLFGNINGEDVLVAAFVGLGVSALAFMGSPIGLPFNIPFVLLGILLSTIQALVFSLLSTVYIMMMLPHEEHH